MNLTQLITDYDKSAKLKNSSTKKPVVEKEPKRDSNGKEIKTQANKLSDMQLSSIMYTNEQYKKKMFKAKIVPTYKTFDDKESFNSFINNCISEMKKMNWKQIPLSHKIPLCKEYIMSDDSLNEEEKNSYILKIDNKNILKAVVYDKENSVIKKFDYRLLN
jgi:hypothetical protein